MPELEFAGPALSLTDADIAAAADDLGVEPALIAAVAEVESAGAGFLPDKRPKILFEAHVFGQRTQHRYDSSHPWISAPKWDRSLYGASGAHQYDRLHEAMRLDRTAALESASWGRFQIMGFNHAICGFSDIDRFVEAMRQGEGEHLKAFIAYCQANDLIRHLIVHDWRAFTRGYNGSGQVDRYSTLLEQAYHEHAERAALRKSPLPQQHPGAVHDDPIVAKMQAVQDDLRAAGFDPGASDGWPGTDTLAAMRRYRRARGI